MKCKTEIPFSGEKRRDVISVFLFLSSLPRKPFIPEELTLQALSVALQVEKDWDPVKYVRCHPGGKLGQLRENEK